MAEIVRATQTNNPGDEGWKCTFEIKRDDGEVVIADVSCTRTAQVAAAKAENVEALASMGAQGRPDVLQIAEKVQSPSRRGRTLITAFYDAMDRGDFRWDVRYERGR